MIKPRLFGFHQPKRAKKMETYSAGAGNCVGDRTEVSRRNSSQMLIVMVETR